MLWPRPGRVFAVGPSHTFASLADAINTAFARWDIAHLSEFSLADGTVITDLEFNEGPAESIRGPITLPIEMATTKVGRTVRLGDEFRFIFDFGDRWLHRCVVELQKVDPMEVLGIRPKGPLPYWGGGDMPDQYGRRWMDDDGESRAPRRPVEEHPMLGFEWPLSNTLLPVNKDEVHNAIESRDASWFLDTILDRRIEDDDLHLIASGAPLLLEDRTEDHLGIVVSLMNRLTFRRAPGDKELAEELRRLLCG